MMGEELNGVPEATLEGIAKEILEVQLRSFQRFVVLLTVR